MKLNNPVLVGFGIKDKTTFDSACKYANGAIIGSAFIQSLSGMENISTEIKDFVNKILG
jgi:tryptophan synthase alpha chain